MKRLAFLLAAVLGVPSACVGTRPDVSAPRNMPMAADGTAVMHVSLLDGTYCTWEYEGGKLVRESCAKPR